MAFRTQIVGSDLADLADNQQLCAEMRSLNHKWKPGMPESEKYIVTGCWACWAERGETPQAGGNWFRASVHLRRSRSCTQQTRKTYFGCSYTKKVGYLGAPNLRLTEITSPWLDINDRNPWPAPPLYLKAWGWSTPDVHRFPLDLY